MVSLHLAMFDGRWSSAIGDIKYLACDVTLQNQVIDRSSNLMSGSSLLCHHIAKFGDHRYFSTRDIFLVSHMIKQGRIIKVQVTMTIIAPRGKSPSYKVWWP